MTLARPVPSDAGSAPRGKGGFARRVFSFAKHAGALQPALYLWLVTLAMCVLMIVTGAFNTAALPIGRRVVFWALLLGWNAIKWQIWIRFTMRGSNHWVRPVLFGVVLTNLPLPLEIRTALALVGIDAGVDPAGIWLRALVISVGMLPVMWLVAQRLSTPVPDPVAGPAISVPGGLLDRARVAPEALIAIEAEDHYCRIRRRNASDARIHYRFRDALVEVAALGGLRVHRSAWVADGAVMGAQRTGRRWRLLLADGKHVPVSARHVVEARRRGWLRAPLGGLR